MHRHFAAKSRGFTKMLREDQCLPLSAKFVSVG